MKRVRFATSAILMLAAVCCGSGSSDLPDLDFGAEKGVVTLRGTLFYDGDMPASEIALAIIEDWPMSAPPKEFVKIPAPEGGFPSPYSLGLSYSGTYFIVAYIDVDPEDSAIFNPDVDPMMLPRSENDVYELINGTNEIDLVFRDSDELDWWWQ